MTRALLPAGALLALLLMAVLMAPAIPPRGPAACHGIGPAPQPLPGTLLDAFLRAFHLAAPAAANGAVVRCADGVLLACAVGANLPCGPADTRRTHRAADTWCADHPHTRVIPAFVTGHATIYAWRCDGARAMVAGQVAQADAAGFVAQSWRPLAP